MTKTVPIVQARMGSTRLPGKTMLPLGGQPVLRRVLLRLMECKSMTDIVLATTTKAEDDVLAHIADGLGVRVYRGEEQDVLSRYLGAAREAKADVVVRVTADCPLLFPAIVDRVASFNTRCYDFSSNSVVRTWPKGCDVEAMTMDLLERMARLADSPGSREHVCTWAYREHPELVLIRQVCEHDDQSHLSWTLDTQDDYQRLTKLVQRAGAENMNYRSVLEVEYAHAHDEDVR